MDIFNWIAPLYSLFYQRQERRFRSVLEAMSGVLNVSLYETILDVGCGTGALCDALSQRGFAVTGVDVAQRMLNIAARKKGAQNICYVNADVLAGLPFEDNCFDVSIASYVAHGMSAPDRKKMYEEMSRVSRRLVIIHDYNAHRSWRTSVIEQLEGGDYFRFIKQAEKEIAVQFEYVNTVQVGPRAAWYIFLPKPKSSDPEIAR